MKYIILTLLLLCGIASTAYANLDFSGSLLHRERPNGLMITGICVASTGAVVAGIGGFVAVFTGDTGGKGSNTSAAVQQDYTGLYIVAAGAGMIAAGITLIVVGKSKQQRPRWGVISPKSNEIGLAYNFK